MKTLPESIEHCYMNLRLTKSHLVHIHSLLGDGQVTEMQTGRRVWEHITDLDTIEDLTLNEFIFTARYINAAGGVDIIRISLRPTSASISLDNVDNDQAYSIFNRIHDFLKSKGVFLDRYGKIREDLYVYVGSIWVSALVLGTALCSRYFPSSSIGWFFLASIVVGGIAWYWGYRRYIWEIRHKVLIYLTPTQPGFWARHKEHFAVRAVEIVIGAVLLAVFSGVSGTIGFYLGKGKQQATTVKETPAASTTQPQSANPTTAPAKKTTI